MQTRYLELFLTESRDHLSAVTQSLLELERAGETPEQIDALFRAMHSLKGMSGVMGYSAIELLAHEVEALLSAVRAGERTLTPDDVALMFEAADVLEEAVERSAAGAPAEIDTAPIAAKLREAAGASPAVRPAAQAPDTPLPAAAGVGVHVALTANCALRGARALIVLQRVRALGTVTAVLPAESSFSELSFDGHFAFRLDGGAARDAIEAAVRGAGDVDRVSFDDAQEAAAPSGVAAPDAASAAGPSASGGAPRYARIDLQRLDTLMNLIGELVIARGRLARVAAAHADRELDDVVTQASNLIASLQDGILASRMVPVGHVFDRFPRVVRDAARQVGKEVELRVEGREIELDRVLLEQIGDAIVHLLRNAVDHGIESPERRLAAGKARAGRLVLSASRDRSSVVLRVTDDGGGIDRAAVLRRAQASGVIDPEREELTDDELLRLIARPGFSTAERVTNLSGRGVGIDAVLNKVRGLGGSVELRSRPGEGTTFALRLPVTLAIIPALLATVGGETYALPLTHIRETLQLTPAVHRQLRGKDVLLLRDEVLALRQLREIVGLPPRNAGGGQVVVIQVADRRAGLVVDLLLGQAEIVVKPYDAVRGAVSCFSGATILTDGTPALIVEVSSLV
jgi:two-component system chemotaxis sensor kinase CheA